MKIIFLDMDGVMNGYPFLDSIPDRPLSGFHEKENRTWWEEMINPKCVERLQTIVEATEAKVVLSTSWRMFWEPDEMQEMLEDKGFAGEIIGKTPRRGFSGGRRGQEIQQWLDDTDLDIEAYVALDDCAFMYPVTDRWVQTSEDRNGITDEEAQQAIDMLLETKNEDS